MLIAIICKISSCTYSKLSVLPANPLPLNSIWQVDITMSLLVWAISTFNLQSDEPFSFSQIMGTVDVRCNFWGGSPSDKAISVWEI